MSEVLVALGYAAPRFHLPYLLVYGLAQLLWFLSLILRPLMSFKPTFTPMRVALAGTHHYYSCDRAKQDLGYKPVVRLKEGIERTVQSYPHLRKGAWFREGNEQLKFSSTCLFCPLKVVVCGHHQEVAVYPALNNNALTYWKIFDKTPRNQVNSKNCNLWPIFKLPRCTNVSVTVIKCCYHKMPSYILISKKISFICTWSKLWR